MGVMQPEKGSAFKDFADKAPEVMKNLAMARRTHRWCKEFPVIQSIPKSLEIPGLMDRILDLVQKVSLASFMIIDHIGWLKQVKVYNGGKRTAAETIQLGLKFLFVSNSIAAIVGMQKLGKTPDKEENAKKAARAQEGYFEKCSLRHPEPAPFQAYGDSRPSSWSCRGCKQLHGYNESMARC